MVVTLLMVKARWLAFASLTFGICWALSGCGSSDGRPGSLVSAGGQSGSGGGHAGHGGQTSDAAGQTGDNAGDQNSGGDDAGAAGQASSTPLPLAIFPNQLQVDAACGGTATPAELVIRNAGILPLTISSATATAGYVVTDQLPIQVEAMASAVLHVAPPAPSGTASVGHMSSGTLTFVTNEDSEPQHEVALNTTLFGGQLEFTDGNGNPLKAALPLTYLSSDTCPDDVTYRVHNTGNVAFTLLGPTFSAHFGGSSTESSGQNLAPDEYVELRVSGNSSPDGACSANGALTFAVQGSFCGPVPKLSVTWAANTQTTGCNCAASSD